MKIWIATFDTKEGIATHPYTSKDAAEEAVIEAAQRDYEGDPDEPIVTIEDVNFAVSADLLGGSDFAIEEHDLGQFEVTVMVEGGMVQSAVATPGITFDVIDLDTGEFADEAEEEEAEGRKKEWEALCAKTAGENPVLQHVW